MIRRVFGNGCSGSAVQPFGRRNPWRVNKHMSACKRTMRNVVLLSCGSFNPVTTTHLQMFRIAKRYLEEEHSVPQRVIAGIISPVNNKYSHKRLADCHHRIEMIRIALNASKCTWVHVDDFESRQLQWKRTIEVIRHFESSVKAGNFLNNTDVNPDEISIEILCGADLIESFLIPNLWDDDHIEEMAKIYGFVILPRNGWNPEKFISEHKILSRFRDNVIVVKSWPGDDVSSTRVRDALAKGNGDSVNDLVDSSVMQYIKDNNLYSSR